MTTAIPQVQPGRATRPFTLADVGSPSWWKCPKCQSAEIPKALWKDCGLYGFECLTKTCRYVWHYTALVIERKVSDAG
jgi:hypothetical protein